MRSLILLRHGEAQRAAATGRDIDRALAPAGVRAAAATACALADRGLAPDVVLVSSARRTQETWVAAQAALPVATVRVESALYHASATQILQLAQAEAGACVMVVGHNPGLGELTDRLSRAGADAHALAHFHTHGFPTAAAAVFSHDAHGRWRLDAFLIPEDAA